MIEFILGAFWYAKKKGYKLNLIFNYWVIVPPLLFCIFYIFLEYTLWIHWYFFLPYQYLIKTTTLLSYVPLILTFKLYENIKYTNNEFLSFITSPMVIAITCLILGSVLNYIVMSFNNFMMPVYPSNSYWTGYINATGLIQDGIHILGLPNTRLIPCSDIFDLGYTILSPGDILVRMYAFTILYNSIKRSNKLQK